MRVLVQRVLRASVTIDSNVVGSIPRGLLLFVCAMVDDSEAIAVHLAEKTLKLRIFTDGQKAMNRSVLDVKGEALVVPQFTLVADTRRGNRPSFHLAEEPKRAEHLYEVFVARLREEISVSTGVFGADMKVELVNDGPVTLVLDHS